MPTYSHGAESSQARSAAQCIASKHHRREVYWCVKHQLLELHRCGKLVKTNTSCVSNELIEEVHAYVMYKLAQKKRCEGTDAVEPDECEQLIGHLVESWRQRNDQPLEPMPRRSGSPPQLRKFKEIEKMVMEDIIFSGDTHYHMDCESPIQPWQPNKTSESTVGFFFESYETPVDAKNPLIPFRFENSRYFPRTSLTIVVQ